MEPIFSFFGTNFQESLRNPFREALSNQFCPAHRVNRSCPRTFVENCGCGCGFLSRGRSESFARPPGPSIALNERVTPWLNRSFVIFFFSPFFPPALISLLVFFAHTRNKIIVWKMSGFFFNWLFPSKMVKKLVPPQKKILKNWVWNRFQVKIFEFGTDLR